MDTIAYLADPEDPTKMTNVVKSHARYTVDTAKVLSQAQILKYDKYDRTNDVAAKAYLLASIEASLSNKVEEKLEEGDTFPIVCLQLIKTIQSTLLQRFEDIKQSIKKRHPSQYAGENLEQLAVDFRRDARELTTAGQHDHNLTLSMLTIFLLAGGSGNEDFRFPLRSVKQELNKALLDIGHKEKIAANQHMIDKKLTYQDICRLAEDVYQTLYDRKEWPPARNVRDSKAPPTAFGHLAIEMNTPLTRAKVLTLIQSNMRGDTKPGNCHECGKAGHWANECSEPSTQNSQANRHHRNTRFSTGNAPSWRTTPPSAGAPTTKKHNDKTFNWCAKCNCWTTTHTGETPNHNNNRGNVNRSTPSGRPRFQHRHRHSQRSNHPKNNSAGPAANLSLIRDPSVWFCDMPNHAYLLSFMQLLPLLMLLLPFLYGIYTLLSPSIHILLSHPLAINLYYNPQLLAAPVFWLFIGFLLSKLNLPAWYRPPDLPGYHTTNHTPNSHFGLKTCHLHRRYPLRLRCERHYLRRRTPDLSTQDRLSKDDVLKTHTLNFQHNVDRHCRLKSSKNVDRNPRHTSFPAVSCRLDREGDNHMPLPSTTLLKSLGPWNRSTSSRFYKPKLASGFQRRGSTHGLGNLRWTR